MQNVNVIFWKFMKLFAQISALVTKLVCNNLTKITLLYCLVQVHQYYTYNFGQGVVCNHITCDVQTAPGHFFNKIVMFFIFKSLVYKATL